MRSRGLVYLTRRFESSLVNLLRTLPPFLPHRPAHCTPLLPPSYRPPGVMATRLTTTL
ncbi:uncharacterized protein SCHCODRAFT_02635774 [Schizophyllum commune H4-8]|uniref:uncharacterized protein n=1 Tax=Schizophyllum commune (strain H4-8 / FGSC 9210) TaxID=578458 RepID=UPI00215F0324|nr:uncharacterized protein SCHCODRAFT_02635774 [Schizophyllum commune H4-8]KAI5888123.1 hypothetical protein SCHCODRAFT_02635774 [Schizophyllum commune H4-8]